MQCAGWTLRNKVLLTVTMLAFKHSHSDHAKYADPSVMYRYSYTITLNGIIFHVALVDYDEEMLPNGDTASHIFVMRRRNCIDWQKV